MPRRLWAVLAILVGAFLGSLDVAIANIALPTIAADLRASPSAVVWVVNAYQLAIAVSLLPLAALGERIGQKRLYIGGMALFTLASLLCAAAPTLGWLVAARVLQGLGGASSSVVGGVLMRTIFPQRLIGRGISLFGLSVAISAALGPSVAAAILTTADWPWLFLVNLPFGLFAIVGAALVLPPSATLRRRFDQVGALLNAVMLTLLILGVDALGEHGWQGPAAVAVALGLGVVLLRHQRRHPSPLVPLDLLRLPVFALSIGTSICSYTAQAIAYIAMPFFLQHGLGYDAVRTGLLVTPWPLVIVVAAPLSGWLSDRYPAGILSSIGLACLAAGLLSLALLPAAPADWDIVWRMMLCGIGFGFFQTPNNRAVLTTGPVARTGAANGMMAQARLIGSTLGAAIVAGGFALLGGDAATVPLLLVAAGVAAFGAVVSVTRLAQ
ncbi:MFS transporter [Roseomonas sp. NAR14]|uniref:MFS transporter n=1 Tax=Roseomonas acroporae TaxID=2937791 RepID=A0A9X1YCH4_9PROT|nr:MFS transporter [Roseomonas acroporae]MCK8787210.1 MFS transporter [Roseomonas acroporae]